MTINVQHLGQRDYQPTWDAMRTFVDNATETTSEEIWLLEHPPVYTLGRNGDPTHLLRDTGIPMIHCDRGGQITYHGPGQLIAYLMLNIRHRRIGLRHLVRQLENTVQQFLTLYGISAVGDVAAPGVYVDGEKIAALGLRLRHGWSYHGVSVNINMDATPFKNINPCGYAGLSVTQLAKFSEPPTMQEAQEQFGKILVSAFEQNRLPDTNYYVNYSTNTKQKAALHQS